MPGGGGLDGEDSDNFMRRLNALDSEDDGSYVSGMATLGGDGGKDIRNFFPVFFS